MNIKFHSLEIDSQVSYHKSQGTKRMAQCMRCPVSEGLETVDVHNLTPVEAIPRIWTCDLHDSVSQGSNLTSTILTFVSIVFACRIHWRESEDSDKMLSSFSSWLHLWVDGKKWQLSCLWEGNIYLVFSNYFSLKWPSSTEISA